jgi:hypothetical protein
VDGACCAQLVATTIMNSKATSWSRLSRGHGFSILIAGDYLLHTISNPLTCGQFLSEAITVVNSAYRKYALFVRLRPPAPCRMYA